MPLCTSICIYLSIIIIYSVMFCQHLNVQHVASATRGLSIKTKQEMLAECRGPPGV